MGDKITDATQRVTSQTNNGDFVHVAHDELNKLQQSTSPNEYNQALNKFSQALSSSDDSFKLPAVELVSGNHQITTDNYTSEGDANKWKNADVGTATRAENIRELRALTANDSELFKKLDNYKNWSNSADGIIGRDDLQQFIDDANNNTGTAADYVKQNPDALKIAQDMRNRMKDADVTYSTAQLLNELGYSANQLGDFNKDHPADAPSILVSKNGPNGLPDTVVTADGTSRGLAYDQSGNIIAINKTNADGTSAKFHLDAKGNWVDEAGNDAGFKAPYVATGDDGQLTYGYYTADANDPTKAKRSIINLDDGKVTEQQVDLTHTDVAGISTPGALNEGAQGKIGGLDVVGTKDPTNPENEAIQGGYQIVAGNNLTEIGRQILGVQPGEQDPEVLQAVVEKLAQVNGYSDKNMIPANQQMIVPNDILYQVAAEQAPQPAEQTPQSAEQEPLPAADNVAPPMAQDVTQPELASAEGTETIPQGADTQITIPLPQTDASQSVPGSDTTSGYQVDNSYQD